MAPSHASAKIEHEMLEDCLVRENWTPQKISHYVVYTNTLDTRKLCAYKMFGWPLYNLKTTVVEDLPLKLHTGWHTPLSTKGVMLVSN